MDDEVDYHMHACNQPCTAGIHASVLRMCMQDEGEEEETDDLVNQVLDEIGISNMSEVWMCAWMHAVHAGVHMQAHICCIHAKHSNAPSPFLKGKIVQAAARGCPSATVYSKFN